MAKPVAVDEQILDAMKTRFNAITTGSDYNYTYANKVYKKSQSPIDEGVNISKGEENVEQLESSLSLHHCTMMVNIDLIDINADVDKVPLMEADILKSVGTDITWSGKAFNTKHISSEDNPQDQQGNAVGHRRITLEVQYRKNAFSR